MFDLPQTALDFTIISTIRITGIHMHKCWEAGMGVVKQLAGLHCRDSPSCYLLTFFIFSTCSRSSFSSRDVSCSWFFTLKVSTLIICTYIKMYMTFMYDVHLHIYIYTHVSIHTRIVCSDINVLTLSYLFSLWRPTVSLHDFNNWWWHGEHIKWMDVTRHF